MNGLLHAGAIQRALGRALIALAALLFAAACTTTSPLPIAGSGTAPVAASPKFSYELATQRLREAAFDRAWHVVNDRFYEADFNGVNWEQVRLRYLPQLERVDSDEAFYALLALMVGELKDSHTRIYSAREYRNRLGSVISTYGLRVSEVEGKVAVVHVFPDTDAARAGIRIGMVIDTINGERAVDRLARLRVEAPNDASPERRLRGIFGRLITGRADRLALEIESRTGVSRVELTRSDREVPLVVTHQTLPGNIGYIAFNRFRPEAAADFARALSNLRRTDGLVIDLRGNPGGSLGSMLSITRNFFPESRLVMTRRLRAADGASPEREGFITSGATPPEMRILGTAYAYTQPIAVLLDNYSASSSELMATILREQRGAGVIGRPTCGCVVAVRPNGYKLPGGGAVYVSESGFVSPFGSRMEGVPMKPDREVALTLADLDAGIDRDLVTAREWLQQRPSKMAEEQ